VIVDVIVVICIIVAALNVWASWLVFRDDLSSSGQRWGQFAFVWLVPLIGALVTLHLKRREPERGSGQYREIPDPGDDFGYSARAQRSAVDETHSPGHVDTPPD
jgi:hypothetical protein